MPESRTDGSCMEASGLTDKPENIRVAAASHDASHRDGGNPSHQ
jgi:hypothetical protein